MFFGHFYISSQINLSTNLTYLSLRLFEMKFDEFELLINKIYSKLKFLSFTTQSEDIDYLDNNR
jgi:hypothetical protein